MRYPLHAVNSACFAIKNKIGGVWSYDLLVNEQSKKWGIPVRIINIQFDKLYPGLVPDSLK